jgi:hypothetical protein
MIQAVRPSITLQTADRDAMLDAMRATAEKRIEGILGHSRRRHYGHAAMLAAACVALAPNGRQRELITWLTVLQQTYSRRSAFRQELWRARVQTPHTLPHAGPAGTFGATADNARKPSRIPLIATPVGVGAPPSGARTTFRASIGIVAV